MARSSYIYLVCIEGKCKPEAAFTVKHEAITYIERTFSSKESLRLYRMPDGRADHWQRLNLDGTQQDKSIEPPENRDVHTEHCCSDHGCKYSDDACSVASGAKKQSHPCEQCL